MPEFYEVVHAKVSGGAEEENVLRRESREAADTATELFAEVPEAGEIHGFLLEGLAHHRGEVAGG